MLLWFSQPWIRYTRSSFILSKFYTGMGFSCFSIHEHSLCSLSQQLTLVFSRSVHFQSCYMNESDYVLVICKVLISCGGCIWNMALQRSVVSFFVYGCFHFVMEKNIIGKLPSLPCLWFLVMGFFPIRSSYPHFLLVSYLGTLPIFEVVVFMAIVPMPWSLLCEY